MRIELNEYDYLEVKDYTHTEHNILDIDLFENGEFTANFEIGIKQKRELIKLLNNINNK